MAAAIDGALRERGTDPTMATLVAQVGSAAFGLAFHRWSEADGASFTDGLHAVFDTLRTSLADA